MLAYWLIWRIFRKRRGAVLKGRSNNQIISWSSTKILEYQLGLYRLVGFLGHVYALEVNTRSLAYFKELPVDLQCSACKCCALFCSFSTSVCRIGGSLNVTFL